MRKKELDQVSAEQKDEGADPVAEVVTHRLCSIVQALDGRDLGTNGDELWFDFESTNRLQVRLSGNREGRCYDRSANFAISYGQSAAELTPSDLRGIIDRIQAIDDAPIDGVAAVFSSCAKAVASRFAADDVSNAGNDQANPGAAVATRSVDAGSAGLSLAFMHQEQCGASFPESRAAAIRTVIVVGGGTAGYFTALALKRQFPELDVTLIESSKIPIIGVGEATTTLMPPFLHLQLGIDIVELYQEVRPTWKLGIKFDWGLPGNYSFIYPFGDGNPVEAYAHDGHIGNQSLCSLMMAADRAPIVTGDDGQPISLLEYMPFAYHLENKSFVAYLEKCAQRVGINHIDAEIEDVRTTPDREGIDRLILNDGRALRGDLYVDASGFRSLLMGKTLGSPFISFASSLFCDGAVVGETPQEGVVEPYTTAQTMDAGWCWRIPVEGEDHRGYVFSSNHITVEQARDEMRAKNPRLGETWTVRFRSGRYQEFWKGNTVAVGNAYGFVEPLESTALHMVILEIRCLLRGLQAGGNGQWDRTFINRSVGEHWDYLRWFLGIHYKYNRKKNTEFWRACRETVDVSGIQPLLEHFQSVGPGKEAHISPHVIPDPVFNYHGVVTMLLGQQVPCPPPTKTWMSKVQWDARIAESRALVARAFTQAQALQLLRDRPELLQNLVVPNSKAWIIPRTAQAEFWKVPEFWINREAELISGGNTGTAIPRQPPAEPKESMPYGHLLGSIAEPSTSDESA